MRTSAILLRTILLAIIILSANQAFPQGKFEISGGLGAPEMINLRLKYGQNIQVGTCLYYWHYKASGIFPESYDLAFSAEIIYHFSGKSKNVEQGTWYLLGGLGYYHLDNLADLPYEDYDIGFYPRIGRTLNFSKKIGLNFDLGLFLPLSAASEIPYSFKILPSGSIGFFIRL